MQEKSLATLTLFYFAARADIEGRFEDGGGAGPESQREMLDPVLEILLEFE